jgi:serine/threonine protein kinase/outer membrane protein assembly factor BamD (BamD/ComL family)
VTGQTVTHYRLVAKIGEGAGAEVYHAHDLSLGREVVLKFVAAGGLDGLARFQHEARTISSLNHPNICTIYEIGEHDGCHFLAMEMLDGDVLARIIGRGPLATAQVIDVGTQIAEALDAAHAERIVHRDLKPANVFVTRSGLVKLLDFGVAVLLPKKAVSYGAERLTSSTAGTIPYMSPEQAQAGELDHRSDLFSLGVVLYEMATGHRPFVAPTGPGTLAAIATCTPVAPRVINPRVPAELERIIAKALEKKPALRYQSASDLRADLQRLQRDLDANPGLTLPFQPQRVSRAPGRRWWAGGAVAIPVLAGAGWLYVAATTRSSFGLPDGPVPPTQPRAALVPAAPIIKPQGGPPTSTRAGSSGNERSPSLPAVDELAVARQQIDLRLYDQAIATLRRAAYSEKGRQAVEALFLTASIHETRNDIVDAMSTYVEIATRFPGDTRAPEALLKLAQATLKSRRDHNHRDVLRTLDTLVDKYPNSVWAPRALLLRADIETREGAFQRDEVSGGSLPVAAVTYRRICERYAASDSALPALQRLAAIYVDTKRFEGAAALLERLAARDDDGRFDAWFAVAEIYNRRLKDPQRARAAYARVPASSPHYAEAQKKKQ